jgi:excisionase family DNA binding protein
MTELLTSEQAAQRLGVTSQTLSVWRCVKRYPLKYIKVGRLVKYRSADIEEFINRRTVSGVDEQTESRTRRRKAS